MKIFKISFFIFLVLLVSVVIFVAIFLQRLDLNQFKPQISQQLTKVLGRNVSIENIGFNFSLAHGILLNVEGVRITDDPQFSKGDWANVSLIQCEMDLSKLFKERTLVFTHLDIRSLQINLVRNAQGVLNIPAPETVPAAGSSTTGTTSEPRALSPATSFVPVFRVNSIRIIDGRVSLKDALLSPQSEMVADKISLGIENFSLAEPFLFSLDLAIASSTPNIHAQGKIVLDVTKSQVQLMDGQLTMNLGKISLVQLKKEFPQLSSAGLDRINGKMALTCSSAKVSAQGLEQISLKADFSEGEVVLKTLARPISDISFKATATTSEAKLERFFARVGSGDMNLKATAKDYLKNPHYGFEYSLNKILLSEVIPTAVPVNAQGELDADLKGEGLFVQGSSDPLNGLVAQGAVKVEGLKLNNLNILKTILEKITFIPGLYDLLLQSMPAQYQQKLARNDVIFQKAQSDIQIKNSQVALPNINLVSEDFSLQAKADFNLELLGHVASTFWISKDLSSSMVQSVPQLNGLMDEQSQIQIPLVPYQGNLLKFKTLPNLAVMGKSMAVGEGKRQLDKVLDKVFGSEETSPSSEGTNPSGGTAPESGRKAIEGILDSILQKVH